MKPIKSLVVAFCTIAFVMASPLRAADNDKKPCCPATVEGEKNCSHECCKKAAESGKICQKCHKEEKKTDQSK